MCRKYIPHDTKTGVSLFLRYRLSLRLGKTASSGPESRLVLTDQFSKQRVRPASPTLSASLDVLSTTFALSERSATGAASSTTGIVDAAPDAIAPDASAPDVSAPDVSALDASPSAMRGAAAPEERAASVVPIGAPTSHAA